MGTVIVILILAAVVSLAIKSIIKDKSSGKGCKSCGGNCSGCGGSTACHSKNKV
ncbi:MAG: FeoB-associated Cys-rich membrane protein [Lachnospiraceae bacterium]